MARRDKLRLNRHQLRRWAAAVVLLAALEVTKGVLFRIPAQAEAYHQRIVSVASASPSHFGTWVSQPAPIPDAAMTMLRPNLTVSRKYTNVATGEFATLLLVQCRDARDLFGHYPPVCYASHGFTVVNSVAQDWQVNGLSIKGMVYTFSSNRPEDLTAMIVYDFMILPDGTTCRDMDGVYASAREPRQRMLGAAQLQVLVASTMPPEQRDKLFLTLVQSNRQTIDAILDGGKRS